MSGICINDVSMKENIKVIKSNVARRAIFGLRSVKLSWVVVSVVLFQCGERL